MRKFSLILLSCFMCSQIGVHAESNEMDTSYFYTAEFPNHKKMSYIVKKISETTDTEKRKTYCCMLDIELFSLENSILNWSNSIYSLINYYKDNLDKQTDYSDKYIYLKAIIFHEKELERMHRDIETIYKIRAKYLSE